MIEFEQWVVMSKDRRWIACGVPRDRELKLITEVGNKRILTYKHKGQAEAGYMNNWFSTYGASETPPKRDELEAVKMRVTYTEV